jgi:hypothetical protein
MSSPYPDRPAPEGWVYIEHPEVGRADHPVKRQSLPVWEKTGWTEVTDTAASAPTAEGATAGRRTRTITVPIDAAKEA